MEWEQKNRCLTGVELLIFDLDGTLADTLAGICDGVCLAMERYGYPKRSMEEVRHAIGNGARELIRRSMPEEASADAALVDRVFADYDRLYEQTFRHACAYEGMAQTLATLRERGYRLAVLSNKQDRYVKTLTEELFDGELFCFAAGQTDLPKKPDPTVPLRLARELGIPPERCAMIGDSEVDIRTGKNAGMRSVGCSWGYRERETLSAENADVMISHPQQLLAVFPTR